MDVLEAIATRRAVRAYSSRVVGQAEVTALLQAAVAAPSAMNRQPWLFSVIQNKEQLKRYSDGAKALLLEHLPSDPKTAHYASLLCDETFNIFYDASTLVVIGVAERGQYSEADCWLAAENLMLAACEARLGSCCIGFAVPVLNTPEVKRELGFPPEGVAIAPVILGYPSTVVPAVARKPPQVLSWSR